MTVNIRKQKSVFIIGPTATGKTSLGVSLARKFNGEIISIDSRQVYCEMDIGTGKDLAEYGQGKDKVSHHLIDIADPSEEYNLYRFLKDAAEAYKSITKRKHLPFFVGGSSLYINALLNSYTLPGKDPDKQLRNKFSDKETKELIAMLKEKDFKQYSKADLSQRSRIIRALEIAFQKKEKNENKICFPKLSPLLIAPYYPRRKNHKRIKQRLDARVKEGLIEEVKYLHEEKNVSWEKLDKLGLEYRWISYYLKNDMSKEDALEKLLVKIRNFCRSQDIWFRKMEREGKKIYWIREGNLNKAIELIEKFLDEKELPDPELKISEIYYGPRQ